MSDINKKAINILRRLAYTRADDPVVEDVRQALSRLDERERSLLWALFIDRKPCALLALCGELHVSQATIYRWRNAALDHFNVALFGIAGAHHEALNTDL